MLSQAATVVVSVTVILGLLAFVAVGLRLYCRYYQKARFGADDYCVLVALVLSTAVAVMVDIVTCKTGVGNPSYQPSLEDAVFALKANLFMENGQIAGMGFVKISLLLYYSRIFISRNFIRAANILIGVVVVFNLAIILFNIFDKKKVHDQWNPTVPYTLNVSALLIAFTAGNAILDILTLSLPILTIRNLQMNAGRKLILSVIFSLGSITIVVTILRMVFSIQYIPFIYNILMAIIELPVFIIVTCLLTLGPLLRAKYGPVNLFRSLQSRLLSNLSRNKKKTGNSSAYSIGTPAAVRDGKWHPWRPLKETTPVPSNESLEYADWELRSRIAPAPFVLVSFDHFEIIADMNTSNVVLANIATDVSNRSQVTPGLISPSGTKKSASSNLDNSGGRFSLAYTTGRRFGRGVGRVYTPEQIFLMLHPEQLAKIDPTRGYKLYARYPSPPGDTDAINLHVQFVALTNTNNELLNSPSATVTLKDDQTQSLTPTNDEAKARRATNPSPKAREDVVGSAKVPRQRQWKPPRTRAKREARGARANCQGGADEQSASESLSGADQFQKMRLCQNYREPQWRGCSSGRMMQLLHDVLMEAIDWSLFEASSGWLRDLLLYNKVKVNLC
ncbi:hypothetical protein B7494_g7887 [Chlorociboria aeruginascens]|nr:hypothetical protein B7494_g7887 [Chlorociboria aeruginascens]